jgi:hypothetical protein
MRVCLLAVVVALLPAVATAQTEDPSAMCLECHNARDLTMTLKSGEALSLFVDPAAHAASVHGGRVKCAECHAA